MFNSFIFLAEFYFFCKLSLIAEKETKVKRRIVGLRQEAPALETDIIDPNTIVPSHWIVV